jgi:hypothetical protein
VGWPRPSLCADRGASDGPLRQAPRGPLGEVQVPRGRQVRRDEVQARSSRDSSTGRGFGTQRGSREITRTPLRERPWLGLSLGRCAQTGQSQICGNHRCCSKTCDVFHIALLAKQAVSEISGSNKNRLAETGRVTCAMARCCGRLPLALGAPEDVAALQLGGTNRRRANPARLPGAAVHVGARPAGPVRRCAVVMPGAYHDDVPAA